MVGVPLFGGFAAKVNFSAAALFTDSKVALTLFVLALSSVLNALYYLPALINLWSEKKPDAPKATRDPTAALAILALACGVLLLGVCFRPVMDLIVRGLALL